MIKTVRPEALNSELRAHAERELKHLLLPYLKFRAFVRFKGRDKKKGHYYGNEHQVTYNQCLFGKVDQIVLNPYNAYNGLINFIENTLKGQWLSAKIYMREENFADFTVTCREYYKGGLELQRDPVLHQDEVQILYPFIKGGKVLISEIDPKTENFSIPEQ